MKRNKTLFVVASGSGGHILPALMLAKKWKEANFGKVIFLTGTKNLDKNILENNNFIDQKIYLNLSKFPGQKILGYPKFVYQLIYCFFKTIFLIKKYDSVSVITTGGYLAIPVCFIARIYKSEIILHELNVVPGKAIKFLQNIATRIDIVFEETKEYFGKKIQNKIFVKNYPLRYSQQDKVFDKDALILKINNQDKVNFELDKRTILILGGSQGSISLNSYFNVWLEQENNSNNIQVIHQTGTLDKTDWFSFYKRLNIPAIVFDYKQNIKDYYLLADLVFARAGAGTLFELEFFGKKSFIFPLKTSYTSHQVYNAASMVERNLGLFELKQF